MNELVKALVKARKGFKPIVKDCTNPFHKSKYASLDSVLESVTDALCDAGLAVVQLTEVKDGKTLLVTSLLHESGQSLRSEYPLPDTLDPQKLGAAMTYGRRYSLCALLSVTADEDDDGNSVSQPKQKTALKAVEQPAHPNTTRIKAVMGWIGFGAETVGMISKNLGLPKTSQMDAEQIVQFRNALFVEWGIEQGVFNHTKHAWSSFQKLLSELPVDASDEQIWQAWLVKVSDKQQEQPA